ncbi:MAG: MBL fold metallo-hydrolase [Anaerolineae bacterium]|jgi:hydroxyacylglutathione hydrolase|nr:MBL fold metallo-hydrolase [Chloroflexota bacterium]
MEIIRLQVGPIGANCYLVASVRTGQALVIDPGDEPDRILAALRSRDLAVGAVVLTHYHFDHVGAAAAIQQETDAPLCIGAGDAAALENPPALFGLTGPAGLRADTRLHQGDLVAFGELALTVLETPGHTAGGISLYGEGHDVLFSGDTLFRRGIGRTDLPGGSTSTLQDSIRNRLYALPAQTVVHPGHGEATTIGEEQRENPFVRLQGAPHGAGAGA